jgi:hypothetical protein
MEVLLLFVLSIIWLSACNRRISLWDDPRLNSPFRSLSSVGRLDGVSLFALEILPGSRPVHGVDVRVSFLAIEGTSSVLTLIALRWEAIV